MSQKPSARKSQNPDPEIRQISVDLISDPVAPIRENLTPESVEDLARSIKEIGIIQPLVVRVSNGGYEVIAGHRRLLAAQVAKLPKVPCVVRHIKEEKADIIKLHENLYRQDLNPIDEGKFFRYLKETYELTNDKIAAKIQKSVNYVRDRVEILEYPEGLREVLKDKQISFAVAKELSKIDDPITLKDYTHHAVKSGVTGSTAAQWARDFKLRKTYEKAETSAAPDTKPPPKTNKSALHCIICQGEVDIKFARISYLHPDCVQALENGVSPAGETSLERKLGGSDTKPEGKQRHTSKPHQ